MSKQRTAPVLIGLTGGPAAGKDTVAALLVEHHGFTHFGLVDPLRDFLYATDEGFRIAVDLYGYEGAKARVSGVRELMIAVNEAAKQWISPTVWSDAIEQRIIDALSEGKSVAVTGVRHPYQADIIHRHGGTVVGVDRPGVEFEFDEAYDTFLSADQFIVNDAGIGTLAIEVGNLVASL